MPKLGKAWMKHDVVPVLNYSEDIQNDSEEDLHLKA